MLKLKSASHSSWFFANDFQELLVFGDFPPIECAWDEDPATQDEIDHQVIPRGPPALLMDTKELNYFDTGKTCGSISMSELERAIELLRIQMFLDGQTAFLSSFPDGIGGKMPQIRRPPFSGFRVSLPLT